MKPYNHKLILLNTDSTEGATESADPLAEAAGGVDTSFPVLMGDRVLELECVSCKKALSKSDPSGQRETLTIVVKTVTDATFRDGKKANPGVKIYKRYGVTVTPPSGDSEGRTIDNIKKDLSLLLKSFYGPKTTVTARDLLNNPAMLEGKRVMGRVDVEKGTGGYVDKNTVQFRIPGEQA